MSEDNPLARRPGRPPKDKAVDEQVDAIGNDEVLADDAKVELTGKELKALKALLSKSEENRNDNLLQVLADAALRQAEAAERQAQFIERRGKTPAEEENERRQKKQMFEQFKRTQKNIERSQMLCEHWAGGNPLSERHSDYTAIVWHEVHDHVWIGLCTVCNRQFWPTDADYGFWRRQKSFNKPSRSDAEGSRQNVDAKGWMEQEHALPFGSLTGATMVEVPKQRTAPSWQ